MVCVCGNLYSMQSKGSPQDSEKFLYGELYPPFLPPIVTFIGNQSMQEAAGIWRRGIRNMDADFSSFVQVLSVRGWQYKLGY